MTTFPATRPASAPRSSSSDNTKDEQLTYKLVTSEESDVTKGLISTTSPIGRALLGKEVGDTATVITPIGKRELEILKLYTIHDKAPK